MRTTDQIKMLYAAYFGGGPLVYAPPCPLLSAEQAENISAAHFADRSMKLTEVDGLVHVDDRYLAHESKPMPIIFKSNVKASSYSKFDPRPHKTKKSASKAVKQTRKKIANVSRKRNRK